MPGPIIAMARGKTSKKGFFARWWKSQKDRQFMIITYVTILSCASVLWGFMFLFMLGGATDPSQEEFMIPFGWFCLIGGSLISFYVIPEFSYYWSERSALEDILSLDARTEVIKRRKEAEDAAEILGRKYQSRLMGLYDHLQIRGGKRFKVESLNPLGKEQGAIGLFPDLVGSDWWNTEKSLLSERLPGLISLRKKETNRLVIISSISAVTLLLLNSLFGFSIGTGGFNNQTIDLSAYLSSVEDMSFSSPHLDLVSILLIIFFSILTISTMPARKTSNQEEEVDV